MMSALKNYNSDIYAILSLYRRARSLQERIIFLKDLPCEEEISVLLTEYLEVMREIDKFWLWYSSLSREEQEFLRFRFWEGLTIKEVCMKMAISPAKAYKLQKNILKKWEVK